MDTLSYVPSVATEGHMQPRVLRAQFGDGYAQEMPDGINPLMRSWTILYDGIHANSGTTPTLSQVDAFFAANAGKKFQWTQPKPYDTEGLKVFVCTDWSFVYQGGLIVGVRANLMQRPG